MNSDLQKEELKQGIAEVRGSLDLTDNGAIRNSIRNCLTVFMKDPLLQGAVSYNLLTERVDIVKPLWWKKQTATLTDTDLNYLMLYLEDNYALTSEKKIQKAISIVADNNKYHPIQDYLNSLEWDGIERIRYALTKYLGAEDSEYVYECLRLFMLGAIHRVFKPGCKFEVMLCLVGGQGAGKSTFFRLLAVKDEWFSDDLKKIDDDKKTAFFSSKPFDTFSNAFESDRKPLSTPLIKENIDGFQNSWLSQTGALMGVRESRRIVGEYMLTASDIAHLRKFDDVIAMSTHGYDIHNYEGPGNVKWAAMDINGKTEYVICNAGGFGLNAAAAGAAHVTCVDASQSAVDTARANAERNGLAARMDFLCADVFELLPELEAKGA